MSRVRSWEERHAGSHRIHRTGEHGRADGSQSGQGRSRGLGLRPVAGIAPVGCGERDRHCRKCRRGGGWSGHRGDDAAGRQARPVGLGGTGRGPRARYLADRLLDHRRRKRKAGAYACEGCRLPLARRAGLGRHGWRDSRDADVHGRWRRRRLRPRQAGPRADGKADRALRRRGRGTGRQDLQQHDPRHHHGRRLRGLRAGRETRIVAPGTVRRGLDLVRPMLVDQHLLPGPRSGARLPGEQRIQAGLRGRAHAEGP